MKLDVYKALWGMTGPLEAQLEQIAAAGYAGIEVWVDSGIPDPQQIRRLAENYRLRVIVATVMPSIESIQPTLQMLSEYAPVLMNVQSGRDAMTFDEGCAFLEVALESAAHVDVPVLHETHRGKLLFTPWTTAAYLHRFPELYITADYSHWVNVCERLPNDQAEALALANGRARHVHARVGYEEGPQVPDPSAPEYASQLAWHEAQWRAIRDAQQSAGIETLTITPEYGSPSYLHTLPHTNVPVADLWRVCLWAAQRIREQLSDD